MTFDQHRPGLLRFVPLILLVGLAGLAIANGWHRHLSLETLRVHGDALRAMVAEHPVESLIVYFIVYALVTASAMPGAVFVTLTGGYLFGTWIGGITTTAAATAGAMFIYLALRTALGDWLRARFRDRGGWMNRMCEGMERDAFWYLLTVRITPMAPFILINIVAGLVAAPVRAYAGATFLGVLPAFLIYSSIGAGLGDLLHTEPTLELTDLIEPRFIWAMAGVGLLSLAAPVALHWFRRGRGAA
ncbi:VTT domain-containing protein [Brevundimonas sp. 2R-24]|uniref:VTT domain-containing protein n=1 Tax=Peiella sedimenti TaxID=3061083 RepID=A0ABT8SKZ4_9CAUL|nr:VTT domain-containing protein [Caulobacteraceae bacterium XZ-24]